MQLALTHTHHRELSLMPASPHEHGIFVELLKKQEDI